MFNKWTKYSYTDQKQYKTKVRNIVLQVLSVIAAYLLLTNVLFLVIVMESQSMKPSIEAGDRMVFSAFSIRNTLHGTTFSDKAPYKRGSVVIISRKNEEDSGFGMMLLDRLIRFCTAGKIGLPDRTDDVFMKRIIGLPGDEITIVNYVLQIKSKGSPYTLTEYELSEKNYDISIPETPPLWDESLPFSGNMSRIVLGEDECFVLSDDRSNTNDSRTWGSVKIKNIIGEALFRYWPLKKFSVF